MYEGDVDGVSPSLWRVIGLLSYGVLRTARSADVANPIVLLDLELVTFSNEILVHIRDCS